ncbi:MAG: D-alanine--D-alanine ligase A [Halobacteriovoraceae bacterium]|nr:D-alanine--D-alanine ligase A [Halobacteriovoraceae bacterium]
MDKVHILLLFGGEEEKDIAAISKDFILSNLKALKNEVENKITITEILINNFKSLRELALHCASMLKEDNIYIIPCIHGRPGESGELQIELEKLNLTYLGSDSDTSRKCFDKIQTKLAAKNLGVPVTPFLSLNLSTWQRDLKEVKNFFNLNQKNIFIKSATQGSSIGCYQVTNEGDIEETIINSFKYGNKTLIEKTIMARELEVAVFSLNEQLIISPPGEILCEGIFYDFEKKYSKKSNIKTSTEATDLTAEEIKKIHSYTKVLTQGLNIKDLARIDFFKDINDGEIYLNEVNTFPGMTPISMFPLLMKKTGVTFKQFLKSKIITEKMDTKDENN